MKTAKEFLVSLHMPYGATGDRFTGGAVKQILARDIEVLEEAAKAVGDVDCYPMYETGGDPLDPVDFKQRCVSVLEMRIAELKKELADGTN